MDIPRIIVRMYSKITDIMDEKIKDFFNIFAIWFIFTAIWNEKFSFCKFFIPYV